MPAAARCRTGDWDDADMQCFGMLMDGRAQPTGIRQRGEDATMLHDLQRLDRCGRIYLAEPGSANQHWTLIIDTNLPEGAQDQEQETETFKFGQKYAVTGRSFLLFALMPDAAPAAPA